MTIIAFRTLLLGIASLLAFGSAFSGPTQASGTLESSTSRIAYLAGDSSQTRLILDDPSRKEHRVAGTFDAPARGEYVSWLLDLSPVRAEALVYRYQGSGKSSVPGTGRLWLVDLRLGKPRALPLPPSVSTHGPDWALQELRFDEQGFPVAKVNEGPKEAWRGTGRTIRFEGKWLPVMQNGKPLNAKTDKGDDYNNLLQHAFRWEGGKWLRKDTLALRARDDASIASQDQVGYFSRLAPSASSRYEINPDPDNPLPPAVTPFRDAAAIRRFDQEHFMPLNGYHEIRAGSGSVVLGVQATHDYWFVGPLWFRQKGGFRADLDNTYDLQLAMRSDYLLVTANAGWYVRQIQLIDVRRQATLLRIPSGVAGAFVPETPSYTRLSFR